jgi:hypothetical protein
MAKKWEYKSVAVNPDRGYGPSFNQLGEEGWELVAIDFSSYQAIFKREKDEAKAIQVA